MSLRFAVGWRGQVQSCSWKLWTQGNEAYLVQRGVIGKHYKFSFHKSGNCRWAEICPGIPGTDRALLEWQRDPVPPLGSGNACLLVSMVFPTNHLSASRAEPHKQVHWIDPALPGHAVLVELLITLEDITTIEQVFSADGERQLLYCETLRDGNRVCAAASLFECGPADLKVPRTDLKERYSARSLFRIRTNRAQVGLSA